MASSTTQHRFQLSADFVLVETATKWEHARRQAIWLWNDSSFHGTTIRICDVMARRRRPTLWRMVGGETEVEAYRP